MDSNYGYVQAAPQENNTFSRSRKLIFIGAGLVVAVIVAILLLLASGQKSISTQAQYLMLRMDSMQTMLSEPDTIKNIRNEELANIVASFSLTSSSDYNDLKAALGSQLPEKMDEKIVLAESSTTATTSQTIEDAYLENRLDEVYVEVLLKKIASIRALLAEIYGLTKSADLKKTLEGVDENLRTTRDQIEKINL